MNQSGRLIFSNVFRRKLLFAAIVAVATAATAQDTVLQLDPAHTSVKFTLGDVLHTVRGTFQLKKGTVQFDQVTGKVAGEIVVDATSGDSGSGMRDRKMHREILESERYPEITFRPGPVEGTVAPQGKSTVQVRGIFSIHGTSHEITVPAEVDIGPDRWTATVHFTVPYVKWGMKNPSTLFLRVNDSVQIDLVASGSVGQQSSGPSQCSQPSVAILRRDSLSFNQFVAPACSQIFVLFRSTARPVDNDALNPVMLLKSESYGQF